MIRSAFQWMESGAGFTHCSAFGPKQFIFSASAWAPCSQALCPSEDSRPACPLVLCAKGEGYQSYSRVGVCSNLHLQPLPVSCLSLYSFSWSLLALPDFRTVSWVQMRVPASYYAFTCLLNPCWDVRAQLCSPSFAAWWGGTNMNRDWLTDLCL